MKLSGILNMGRLDAVTASYILNRNAEEGENEKVKSNIRLCVHDAEMR